MSMMYVDENGVPHDVGNNSNIDTITKNDFAIITGSVNKTSTDTLTVSIVYPDGFSSNNCTVISNGIYGEGSGYTNYCYNTSDTPEIILDTNDIKILIGGTTRDVFHYRVVLMKIA